jgi:hypothetical protein
MSPEMVTTIQTTMMTAFVAITGVLTMYLKSWFETKSLKNQAEKIRIEQEIAQARIEFGLKRMDHIVTNVVGEAEQRKPTGITQTAEENAKILESVKAEVKFQATPEIVAAVASVVRDPDRYVASKIEAAVGKLKREGIES